MLEKQSEDTIIKDVIIEDADFVVNNVAVKSRGRTKLFCLLLICGVIFGGWWVANLPDAKQQAEQRAQQFAVAKNITAEKSAIRAEKQAELQQSSLQPVLENTKPALENKPVLASPLPAETVEIASAKQKKSRKIKLLRRKIIRLRRENNTLQQKYAQQGELLQSYLRVGAKIAAAKPLDELLQSAIGEYYNENTPQIGWGLVSMRKIGAEHQGDDDATIIARVEHYAKHNQLKDAVEEAQKLSVQASPHFKEWRKIAYETLEMQRIIKESAQ